MAIQYKIPNQDLTYQVPEEGEVFRGTTGGLFKRVGGTIYAFAGNTGNLPFDPNASSLERYIVPDAIAGLQGIVGTKNYQQVDIKDAGFFTPTPITPTNEILTQTNRADNPNSPVVTSNLRGVINAGVALPAGVKQAGIDPNTGLPLNEFITPPDTRPFSQTDPNRIINFQTGQTAISAQSIADGIKGLSAPLSGSQDTSGIITTDSFKGGSSIQLAPPSKSSSLGDSTYAGAGATEKSIQDYIKLLTPQDSETSNSVKSLIDSINSEMESLKGRGQAQLTAEQQQGVEAKKQILQNAQTELAQKLAEYKAIQAKYQTLNADIEGKPITMFSIIGSQAQVNRAMQAELNVKASEIAMIQANVAGAQGNLTLAQDAANRAVDLKYENAQDYINIQLKQLELLQGELSKEEKVRADAVNLYLNQQAEALAEQKAYERDTNQTLLKLMTTYNDAGITMSDTIESANRKIVSNSQIYRNENVVSSGGVSGGVSGGGTPVESQISPYQEERITRNLQSVSDLSYKAKQNPGIFGRSAALPIPSFLRSDAYRNFESELDTLKSNITFGELTAMREASKTGGALGQVSDTENRLLSAALGSLNMTQSAENFQAQLKKIQDSITRWKNAVTQYGGQGYTITAPTGEQIIITD